MNNLTHIECLTESQVVVTSPSSQVRKQTQRGEEAGPRSHRQAVRTWVQTLLAWLFPPSSFHSPPEGREVEAVCRVRGSGQESEVGEVTCELDFEGG